MKLTSIALIILTAAIGSIRSANASWAEDLMKSHHSSSSNAPYTKGLEDKLEQLEKKFDALNNRLGIMEQHHKAQIDSLKEEIVEAFNWLVTQPIGTQMLFPKRELIPAGWAECDGLHYSNLDFPALFNVIGYEYTPDSQDSDDQNRPRGNKAYFNIPNRKDGTTSLRWIIKTH